MNGSKVCMSKIIQIASFERRMYSLNQVAVD